MLIVYDGLSEVSYHMKHNYIIIKQFIFETHHYKLFLPNVSFVCLNNDDNMCT